MAESKAQILETNPAKKQQQFQAAEDAIVEIMGRTGDTTQYHDVLATLDGYTPDHDAEMTPEEDKRIRTAFENLYTTFGEFSPIVRQFWQGAASVREARAKK